MGKKSGKPFRQNQLFAFVVPKGFCRVPIGDLGGSAQIELFVSAGA